MDFSKAFDSVPHQRLVAKCEAVGIKGALLKWVKEFLKDRRQSVVINGVQSSWQQVTSGVPQGSVLGPTLFLIYINDLPEITVNPLKIFADDSKLLGRSSHPEHRDSLQKDITAISEWAERWQIRLNYEKCSCLHFGKHLNGNKYTIIENSEPHEIKNSNTEKDLGVKIDQDLKFKDHIHDITSRANRMIGLIRRTFDFVSPKNFVNLYKAVVRPILEYNQVVWSPHLEYLINEIENVQRRATKMLPGFGNLAYEERLKRLDLPSLAHRRLRGDMIETFKLVRGFYDCKLNLPINHGNTRGHSYKLSYCYSRLDSRKYFFLNRVISNWNKLPNDIVNANNVNEFKNKIDKFWGKMNIKFNT